MTCVGSLHLTSKGTTYQEHEVIKLENKLKFLKKQARGVQASLDTLKVVKHSMKQRMREKAQESGTFWVR